MFVSDCTRDVLPTVLTSCHAKKGCALAIDDQLLGKVCPSDANPYLSLLYMCGKFNRIVFFFELGLFWQILTNRIIKSHLCSRILDFFKHMISVNEEIFNEDALRGEFPSLEKYAKVNWILKKRTQVSLNLEHHNPYADIVRSDKVRGRRLGATYRGGGREAWSSSQ